MTDLTNPNGTVFGLLGDETGIAMVAHGGPYEVFAVDGWHDANPEVHSWCPIYAYRVKPQPPKPREFWITLDDLGRRSVFDRPVGNDNHEIIHVREVLE